MRIRDPPRRPRQLINIRIRERSRMIRIISNQGEIVPALSSPLIQSSLHVLSASDFKQDCFLVLCVGDAGSECVEHV